MRSVSVVLILVVAVLAIGNVNPCNGKPHYNPEDAPVLFKKFQKDYNRHYEDPDDVRIHYNAFVNTLKEINTWNDLPGNSTFDINEFADYTIEEMKKWVFPIKPDEKPVHYDVKDEPALFHKFMRDYHKHYINITDFDNHNAAFTNNLIEINELNDKSKNEKYAINEYADNTDDEIKKTLIEKRDP